MGVVIGWIIAIVAIAAFTGGADQAGSVAKQAGSIVGTTAGAIISSIPDLVAGFNAGKDGVGDPAPKKKSPAGGPANPAV